MENVVAERSACTTRKTAENDDDDDEEEGKMVLVAFLLPPRKLLHGTRGDCRQRDMDAMRIFQLILLTLAPVSSVLAQGAGEAAKTEVLVLKAQTVEIES